MARKLASRSTGKGRRKPRAASNATVRAASPSTPKPLTPAATLGALEVVARDYGRQAASQKLASLRMLERAELSRARDVERLHEVLCFLRAYPDGAAVLRKVVRMLGAFAQRPDLESYADDLASTGIAGTEIYFSFFQPLASWLAKRWPQRLAVDWETFENKGRLVYLLPLLVHFAETPALEEYDLSARAWIRQLKGRRETDAAFLIRRFDRLRVSSLMREKLYDELDVPMVLKPSDDTPSRTLAWHRGKKPVFQRRALSRKRPDLRSEIKRPPRAIRAVSPAEARRLLDLASESMVTRDRDLDAFSWASLDDVRMIEFDGGLQFAAMSTIPERRLLLESVYGFLTLKNGVPIGYVLTGALFGSVEIAYNVFETFRGAEAGVVYGRVASMAHHLFGGDTFMIPPYQLGLDNDEALDSGAWWFYRKMGFRPRDAKTLKLMREEEARMRRNPKHRSSRATLRRLSRVNAYYELGTRRSDVLGILDLPNIGLHVSRYLSQRFGAHRDVANEVCGHEAAELLELQSVAKLTADERMAWERWAPLVMVLPGVRRWTQNERRALAAVIRAKGGSRESDFVVAFDRHPKLRRAIGTLAGRKA